MSVRTAPITEAAAWRKGDRWGVAVVNSTGTYLVHKPDGVTIVEGAKCLTAAGSEWSRAGDVAVAGEKNVKGCQVATSGALDGYQPSAAVVAAGVDASAGVVALVVEYLTQA
jgi:hypothetical protein